MPIFFFSVLLIIEQATNTGLLRGRQRAINLRLDVTTIGRAFTHSYV